MYSNFFAYRMQNSASGKTMALLGILTKYYYTFIFYLQRSKE